MLGPILSIAAALAAVYLAVVVAVWWLQERIVYQPPKRGQGPVGSPARFTSADGIELWGWLVGSCTPKSRAILAFHGNAELARWVIPWAEELARRTGVCVMLAEFRGYDGLEGRPTYAGIAADARAARRYLVEDLGVSQAAITYYGFSLGTAVATELASEFPPRALVLQAPLSSARAMARRMALPGLSALWRAVSRVHYDTLAIVGRLDCPVWVAHGDRDLVIPVSMGREVFAAAAKKGELLIVPGAGHNELAELGGEEYWVWLEKAVNGDTQGRRVTATREGDT